LRRLFIADVHANLPAFEAVLSDAGPVDEVFFLGDIVDCGPHPAECVTLLRDIGATCIVGNHDEGVLSLEGGRRPPREWVDWQEWTFDQLTAEQRAYVGSFPRSRVIRSCGVETRLIHSAPNSPYLHESMTDEQVSVALLCIPGIATGLSTEALVAGVTFVCGRSVSNVTAMRVPATPSRRTLSLRTVAYPTTWRK